MKRKPRLPMPFRISHNLPWISRLLIIRGAGDLASGCIQRLHRVGFAVLALETAKPLAVRRGVSFSEAVYEGRAVVEGLSARLAKEPAEVSAILDAREVAVLVDPDAAILAEMSPACLVDAIMKKRNIGTNLDMAPFVIGLGPGFDAGVDVDAVVETMRGHYLGRVIREGRALADTGIPGLIDGKGEERVLHAPGNGIIIGSRAIGEKIGTGESACRIETEYGILEVKAQFDGVLRGMLREGTDVEYGMKIGDLDPRANREHCFSVSDKSRAIAGGVLEAILAGVAEDGP